MITVEQVHAFMDAMNAGRTAYGLEPLSGLEFDSCKPGNNRGCLSAQNLLVPIGGMRVGDKTFQGVPQPERLAEVLGTGIDMYEDEDPAVVIPSSILRVTNEFDNLERLSYGDEEYGVVDLHSRRVKAFRQVLVEAGAVKD